MQVWEEGHLLSRVRDFSSQWATLPSLKSPCGFTRRAAAQPLFLLVKKAIMIGAVSSNLHSSHNPKTGGPGST